MYSVVGESGVSHSMSNRHRSRPMKKAEIFNSYYY